VRTFSFGAGVQSTAVLVLQAEGRLPEPYDAFLFANVGDDSEHPDSLKYFHEVHVPYAEKHGIPLHELRRTKRDGTRQSLYETLMRPIDPDDPETFKGKKKMGIPFYQSNGAPASRSCTVDFKITVIHRWQREHGATRDNPCTSGLGISMDEIQRARTDSGFPDQLLDYPLLDLRMNRRDCVTVTAKAGLPPAPKSACFFCPFHSRDAWRTLKRETPDLFEKACGLEDTLNAKREAFQRHDPAFSQGRSTAVYLSKFLRPLNDAIDDQLVFDWEDGPDGCDSGSCFT